MGAVESGESKAKINGAIWAPVAVGSLRARGPLACGYVCGHAATRRVAGERVAGRQCCPKD